MDMFVKRQTWNSIQFPVYFCDGEICIIWWNYIFTSMNFIISAISFLSEFVL